MKIVRSPPLTIAGVQLRVLSEIKVDARFIGGCLVANCEKRPIALLIEAGSSEQVINLGEKEIDLTEIDPESGTLS